MKHLLKGNTKFLILTLIIVIVNSVLIVAVPILMRIFFSSTSEIDIKNIIIIFVLMLLSYGVQIALIHIRENFSVNFNVKNNKKLFEDFFYLKYDIILEKEPTFLVNKILTTSESLYIFFISNLTNILSSAIIGVITLIICISINIYIGLALVFLLPVNYFGFRYINKILTKKSKALQRVNSEHIKNIIAISSKTDYIKQLATPEPFIGVLEKPLQEMYETVADVNKFAMSSSTMMTMFNSLIQNFIFIGLSVAVALGYQDLYNLIIVSILLPIFIGAVGKLSSSNLAYSKLKVAGDFMENDLIANYESSGKEKINSVDSIDININEVEVAGKVVTLIVNEEIKKGDTIYVNGESGSGKSTLLKLLLKFREVDTITVNGIDIRNIENKSLRSKITYVSQDIPIFPLSIKENIEFGVSEAVDWEKLKNSGLLASILKNKTLDTLVNEGGTNLSGGEKQRLALCRILSSDFDVVVLDEITSSLDLASSKAIYKDILTDIRDKIIFITSHEEYVRDLCNKEIIIKNK